MAKPKLSNTVGTVSYFQLIPTLKYENKYSEFPSLANILPTSLHSTKYEVSPF